MRSSFTSCQPGTIVDARDKDTFGDFESGETLFAHLHDKENIPLNIIRKNVAINVSPTKIGSPLLTGSGTHLNRSIPTDCSVMSNDNMTGSSLKHHNSSTIVQNDLSQYPKVYDETSYRPGTPPTSSLMITAQDQNEPDIESVCIQSPNTTILKLKKGQRVKDGMILMLSGQVDRRKQLLLGAQVQQRVQHTNISFAIFSCMIDMI